MRTAGFILMVALAAAVACGEDPEPRPTPTTTAAAESPGLEGFRAFAAQIQNALDRRDNAFFLERVRLLEGICTEDDVAGGIGAAPCETVGEPWQAFQTGVWRSEVFLQPLDDDSQLLDDLWIEALPDATDDFGDGRPRVYALVPGGDSATAILTSMTERPPDFAGEGPLRIARVTSWSFDGERWRLTSLLIASVLAEEFLIPCPAGLDFLGTDDWERYPDPDEPPLDEELCPL